MNFSKLNPLYIILGVLALLLVWSVSTYNNFITQSNSIDAQWKQVEVQYQRRYDLIPNLVNSTKGLMAQEQKVFGDIAQARTKYGQAQNPEAKVQAANQLDSALSRLLVVVENYPQLKSDQAVLSLMDELSGTENRIAVERRRYNDQVRAFNTSIATFPGNVFAGVFGFKPRTYFNATTGSENAPQVKF